jgi:hypothetical protein
VVIAAVVAPAGVPRDPVRERQPQAAGAARLFGIGRVAVAAAEILAVVVSVVAEAEEPDKPHDEGSDVEDSETHHEDPPLQGHRNPTVGELAPEVECRVRTSRAGVPEMTDVTTTLVLFGATGDLARSKLWPALHDLAASGRLPAARR